MQTKFDLNEKVKSKNGDGVGKITVIRIRNDNTLYNVLMDESGDVIVFNENEIEKCNEFAEKLRKLARLVDNNEIKLTSFSDEYKGKSLSENHISALKICYIDRRGEGDNEKRS